MDKYMLAEAVPMYGRMIHTVRAKQNYCRIRPAGRIHKFRLACAD